MRLAQLLAKLPDNALERLAIEHARTDEKLARPQLCNLLEGSLRSYRFVSDFILGRQPPTFGMLTALLEAPSYELPREDFLSQAASETERIKQLVDSKELVARDDQLRLYRRALYEARRNDLDVNTSEAAVLAVLRRELGIAQVEHFLIEHHQDFREFWDRDDCLAHEENALTSAGLLFAHEGKVLIPEDLAPAVRQVLGIDMTLASSRRLFGYLESNELAAALEAAGSRVSGTKETRIDRLIQERIQPRFVLRTLGIGALKEICRAAEASVSGSKDKLIERIVSHFAEGKDQIVEEPPEPPRREPRRLTQSQFETMFSALLHQELSDILRRLPELRQTGTKEMRIKTLWDAHLSEATLLGELMNRQLEDVLHRIGLRLSGSKEARIERLIAHFSALHSIGGEAKSSHEAVSHTVESVELSPEIIQNQALFRLKASNPTASLQPWLEELLEGNGLVRCNATEDANQTKQLKNKLSQAAAAQDGLLVLLLADESAYLKAREALYERWMHNAEWPKSVACIALAYPFTAPVITCLIERVQSSWPEKVRRELFPGSEVLRVRLDERHQARVCASCAASLPEAARFCSNCGAPVGARSDARSEQASN